MSYAATKKGVLVIYDSEQHPIACVIRNTNHFVFFTLTEMDEDDIQELFRGEEQKL